MKRNLLAVTTLLCTTFFSPCHAQTGEWTWMKGMPIAFGSNGVWGTQGVADPANEPPAVYEACEFNDDQGNLWVFGGVNNSSIIYYGTMWKYDPTTNMWVWVSGPGVPDQPGVYGTQGVPSASNYPGARGWGSLSWTDSSGDFWLFGGYGYDETGAVGVLGDLWKYDVSTNEWTWVKGSSVIEYYGSYGVQGVPDIANNPPARQESSCAWVDSSNALWMFGGWSQLGNSNDLWKYDIPSNTWTWMKGSSFGNQYGIYGTMGVSSPLNVPGGRAAYTRWVDTQNNLWLYGGNGNGGTGNGFLSDLWKYTMSTNEWTWIGGSTIPFQLGVYSSKCDFSPVHYPSNKYEARACWVDDCGYFFMYGGTSYNGHQGDLWVYNYVANEWAWINGDTITNTSASPGTQGVSSPTNKPGLRTGANSWLDQSGNLWLFGGLVCSNDMWRFVPDYDCIGTILCPASQQTSFSVTDSQVCEKFCVDFSDASTNNPDSWLWLFPGGSPASSTDQNPLQICYQTPGIYDVTLITTNASGNDTLTLANYITVYPTPPFPTITQNGNTLTSSVADFYQWQFNSIDIPGATSQSYTATQTGFYTIIVSDANGCINLATLYVEVTGIGDLSFDQGISIYPNPSNGNFTVDLFNCPSDENIVWKVTNALGQEIFVADEKIYADHFSRTMKLMEGPAGIYFLELKTDHFYSIKKLIISR